MFLTSAERLTLEVAAAYQAYDKQSAIGCQKQLSIQLHDFALQCLEKETLQSTSGEGRCVELEERRRFLTELCSAAASKFVCKLDSTILVRFVKLSLASASPPVDFRSVPCIQIQLCSVLSRHQVVMQVSKFAKRHALKSISITAANAAGHFDSKSSTC